MASFKAFTSSVSSDAKLHKFDTVADEFIVERQSVENVWLNGNLDGDTLYIAENRKSVILSAKNYLLGWYWAEA